MGRLFLKRSVKIFATASFWGALPIPELTGDIGMFGLCVFGKSDRERKIERESLCVFG